MNELASSVPAVDVEGVTDGTVASSVPARSGVQVEPGRRVWLSRIAWFFLFAPPTAVIATATFLTPDPAGHGTHTQLGLPPCGFFVMTGYPCPGCGLTTCFTHMVHFEWLAAVSANPFGVMLFFVSVACAVTAFVGLVRGLPVMETLERFQADKIAMLLAVCSLLVWGVRVGTLIGSP